VKFGGLKFLDTAHIKDMLALLRFVENPRDRVAGFGCCICFPASVRLRRSACLTICSRRPIHRRACMRAGSAARRQGLA